MELSIENNRISFPAFQTRFDGFQSLLQEATYEDPKGFQRPPSREEEPPEIANAKGIYNKLPNWIYLDGEILG